MRTVSGSVTVSQQLFEATRKSERNWNELEWIALHYNEATDEQRARLDRVMAAIDRLEDER